MPKGHGVLPISGELSSYNLKEVVWEGFTIDLNQQRPITVNGIGQTFTRHDNPITQNIVCVKKGIVTGKQIGRAHV